MPGDNIDSPDAELLAHLYANAPIGLCSFDLDFKFVQINEWLASKHGLSVEEHLGGKVSELLPALAQEYEDNISRVIETGETHHYLSNIEFPDSSIKTQLFELYFYPVSTKNDSATNGIGLTIHNVTERELIREKIALAASNFWLIKHLTNREYEIVELASGKLYDKEIASQLSISVDTVKTHMKKVFKKLKVNNRREAVAKVQSLKILNIDSPAKQGDKQ